MSDSKRIADVQPGENIDLEGHVGPDDPNYSIWEFEFANVESINGGWMDRFAKDGEVVVYTTNGAAPVILPADTIVNVQEV